MNKTTNYTHKQGKMNSKIFSLILRRIFVLLIGFSINSIYANSFFERTNISIDANGQSYEELFEQIQSKSEFIFTYKDNVLDTDKKVFLNLKNVKLSTILDLAFYNTDLEYSINNRQVVINKRDITISDIQQDFTITGTITDKQGNPLPGASVLEKGTTNGTQSDFDGNFNLTLSSGNATLTVSFIGYGTKEVAVENMSSISIILEESATGLDAVVVLGYGSQRKGDITSAVSEVDLETLENMPVSNASRLIQGQAAGVQVDQVNGGPGNEFQVRIRGNGSLGASNDPLYVIDGFPVGNSIGQTLNPNDIESITILKDAASTSIYGARSANGVVLITTKAAKDGVSKMSISYTQGLQNIPDSRKLKVMNAQQFVQFQNERISELYRRTNGGAEPSPSDIPLAWRFPDQDIPSTNWFNEILRSSPLTKDLNFNITNGTKKLKSSISLGYFNQEGTLKGTDFNRFNARINLNSELNDVVSVNWNMSGTLTEDNNPGNANDGNFITSVVNSSYLIDPRAPVYNEDGTFNQLIGSDGLLAWANPVQRLHEEINRTKETIFLTNGSVAVRPIKGLKFESIINASIRNSRNRQYSPSNIPNWNTPPPKIAFGSENSVTVFNYGWDNLLSYNLELDNHTFDATLGYVIQKEEVDVLTASGQQFPNDLIPYVSGANETSATSSLDNWNLAAYFGRLNYNYLDRYLFSASFRREGSSRFGINNKWGNFPAFSAGWRISKEEFFPENDLVTDLKLRTSWGITGNNNIGNYSHLSRLFGLNYVLGGQVVGGQSLLNYGNPDLTWETSKQLDIGLDIRMFNNKLSVVAEYYRRITEDMLLPVSVPATSGFNTALSNIGKVENKGFELGLNYKDRLGDFGISANFNIAFNRNEILEINDETDQIFNFSNLYGANNIYKVGQPIGMLYGFIVEGVFNSEEEIAQLPSHPGNTVGSWRFRDVNGDGEITYDTQDWDYIGDPNPDFTWGLNLNMDYKSFDLSLGFTGAQGYDLFRFQEPFLMITDGVVNNSIKMIDRWRSPDNPGNGYAAAGTGNFQFSRENSDKYVWDASHVWFKNITLGYNIPSFSDKIDVRLYGSIDNVALLTDYPGTNPQANSGITGSGSIVTIGVDNDTYPIARTFSFGVNLNF